jgi:hypothetical protein
MRQSVGVPRTETPSSSDKLKILGLLGPAYGYHHCWPVERTISCRTLPDKPQLANHISHDCSGGSRPSSRLTIKYTVPGREASPSETLMGDGITCARPGSFLPRSRALRVRASQDTPTRAQLPEGPCPLLVAPDETSGLWRAALHRATGLKKVVSWLTQRGALLGCHNGVRQGETPERKKENEGE